MPNKTKYIVLTKGMTTSQTTDVGYLLSKAQAATQSTIANNTALVTRRGIGTPGGLYGALQDGVFLNNHFSMNELSEGDIQARISHVARVRLLVAIWKAKVRSMFFRHLDSSTLTAE